MMRRAHLALPGVSRHLIQRGNNRQACFFADEDYHSYLKSCPIPSRDLCGMTGCHDEASIPTSVAAANCPAGFIR